MLSKKSYILGLKLVSRKTVRNADTEAGAFFTLFGVATSILSLEYKLGTAAQLGPGFFPLSLGILLTAVGLVILVKGWTLGGEEVSPVPLIPMMVVALSLLAFAVLILHAGLLFAIPAMVFVSLFASPHFTLLRATALSVALLGFCYLVFVLFLGIPVPLVAW